MKKIAILVAAFATAVSGVMPAEAFPIAAAPRVETSQPAQTQPVEQVQWRHRGDGWSHGDFRNARPHRYYRGNHGRYYRGNHGRYYGNRYYRGRHYGGYYRRGPSAGAIIGGLAAGAIIGGALAQPRYYGGNSHTSWCYNRYRSYRASDNTFQPNYGPRRQCVSP